MRDPSRTRAKVGMGASMAGGNPDPTRGRAEDDFYPTPSAVTHALVRRWYHQLRGRTVWEPCAGDGAMLDAMVKSMALAQAERGAAAASPHHISLYCASDIAPRAESVHGITISKHDVFAGNVLPGNSEWRCAVVTNPPFFLAARMIPHILTMEGGPPQFLAMVLKSSFWHAATRYPLFKSFPPSYVHPLLWRPDFKKLGAPTMEMMWCVWLNQHSVEKHAHTVYEPLENPGDV